jgi:hypothetical protein
LKIIHALLIYKPRYYAFARCGDLRHHAYTVVQIVKLTRITSGQDATDLKEASLTTPHANVELCCLVRGPSGGYELAQSSCDMISLQPVATVSPRFIARLVLDKDMQLTEPALKELSDLGYVASETASPPEDVELTVVPKSRLAAPFKLDKEGRVTSPAAGFEAQERKVVVGVNGTLLSSKVSDVRAAISAAIGDVKTAGGVIVFTFWAPPDNWTPKGTIHGTIHAEVPVEEDDEELSTLEVDVAVMKQVRRLVCRLKGGASVANLVLICEALYPISSDGNPRVLTARIEATLRRRGFGSVETFRPTTEEVDLDPEAFQDLFAEDGPIDPATWPSANPAYKTAREYDIADIAKLLKEHAALVQNALS